MYEALRRMQDGQSSQTLLQGVESDTNTLEKSLAVSLKVKDIPTT